jgi:hypothetical protein
MEDNQKIIELCHALILSPKDTTASQDLLSILIRRNSHVNLEARLYFLAVEEAIESLVTSYFNHRGFSRDLTFFQFLKVYDMSTRQVMFYWLINKIEKDAELLNSLNQTVKNAISSRLASTEPSSNPECRGTLKDPLIRDQLETIVY